MIRISLPGTQDHHCHTVQIVQSCPEHIFQQTHTLIPVYPTPSLVDSRGYKSVNRMWYNISGNFNLMHIITWC